MKYKLIQDVFKAGNFQWRAKWKWGIFWISLKEVSWGDSYSATYSSEQKALEAINDHFLTNMRLSKDYSVIKYVSKELE